MELSFCLSTYQSTPCPAICVHWAEHTHTRMWIPVLMVACYSHSFIDLLNLRIYFVLTKHILVKKCHMLFQILKSNRQDNFPSSKWLHSDKGRKAIRHKEDAVKQDYGIEGDWSRVSGLGDKGQYFRRGHIWIESWIIIRSQSLKEQRKNNASQQGCRMVSVFQQYI